MKVIRFFRWDKFVGCFILMIFVLWVVFLVIYVMLFILLVGVIVVGILVISVVGCVVNDLWDWDIDLEVERICDCFLIFCVLII